MRTLGVFAAGLALAALPLALAAGSPSPTATPTAISTATATPTAVPTFPDKASPTDTPGPPAATPTPAPLLGSAHIYGNIFHPLRGGLLPLSYNEPYASTVDIDLYDRLGRQVAHLSQTEGPGAYTLEWDGRGDDGVLVSSGVYEAYFHGKGLSSLVKFAVIK